MHDSYSGRRVDPDELESEITSAVRSALARQVAVGIDVVSDGEMSKLSFSHYVRDRLGGFSEPGTAKGNLIEDLDDFPGVLDYLGPSSEALAAASSIFACTGALTVSRPDAVRTDLNRFARALDHVSVAGAFVNAATPGQITFNFPNRFYDSHEAYLMAAAAAMRHEYQTIAAAGFVLQLDSPDLAMSAHVRSEDSDLPDIHRHNRAAITALNVAVAGIPREQLRLHICWGNYGGPHNHDIDLAEIIDGVLQANVGTFSFEAANPRHAHEWEIFRDIDLPAGAMIMPGVIDVTTQRIEHPRLVAQRLIQFARLVGRENVIAGTDCGFGTVAGLTHVDPEVAWAKLSSLVEGARIASCELWP
jgi:5-methyltetrahydropteroyltriglutamate--homocysteine methyltransferase